MGQVFGQLCQMPLPTCRSQLTLDSLEHEQWQKFREAFEQRIRELEENRKSNMSLRITTNSDNGAVTDEKYFVVHLLHIMYLTTYNIFYLEKS